MKRKSPTRYGGKDAWKFLPVCTLRTLWSDSKPSKAAAP